MDISGYFLHISACLICSVTATFILPVVYWEPVRQSYMSRHTGNCGNQTKRCGNQTGAGKQLMIRCLIYIAYPLIFACQVDPGLDSFV